MPEKRLERTRKSYKCLFCKGLGWIAIAEECNAYKILNYKCGMCEGTGIVLYKQVSQISSIEND